MKIGYANILTAFNTGSPVIGSRVINAEDFLDSVSEAIREFDFAGQKVAGQGKIQLPDSACQFVSAGVGRKIVDPDAYVLRAWRGSVSAFLKREFASPVESVEVVVYTTAAYLSDPDVASDEAEVANVRLAGWTHVIVAVLASAGPDAPLSPGRFVANLAGGNKEALVWTADEIRAKAKEIRDYQNEWSVVAD